MNEISHFVSSVSSSFIDREIKATCVVHHVVPIDRRSLVTADHVFIDPIFMVFIRTHF